MKLGSEVGSTPAAAGHGIDAGGLKGTELGGVIRGRPRDDWAACGLGEMTTVALGIDDDLKGFWWYDGEIEAVRIENSSLGFMVV